MTTIVSTVLKAPTDAGLILQHLMHIRNQEEFVKAFLDTLRAHAFQLGFEQPQTLQPSLHKLSVAAIAGADDEQLAQLYARMQTELECQAVHPNNGPDATLEGMAIFYYQQLRNKVAPDKW